MLIPVVDAKPLQCTRCWEYAARDSDRLRPLDPSTVSSTPTFRAPIFKNARWPKACVGCGAEPTRFGRVTTYGLIVAQILIAMRIPRGVPYCDVHRDLVHLDIALSREVYLRWTSLGMMRRYLAANRQSLRTKTGLW
jgi:hypothetical protein